MYVLLNCLTKQGLAPKEHVSIHYWYIEEFLTGFSTVCDLYIGLEGRKAS
jgi:hypothetical protein